MIAGLGLLQVLHRNASVDLGVVDIGVAQQALDVADIGPVSQKVGGAGVAKAVRGDGLVDTGFGRVVAHQVLYGTGLYPIALGG